MTAAKKEKKGQISLTHVALAELIPYVHNARTHTAAQVDQLAASIKEFGFVNPILTDGANGVIAGHGRLLAARKLKLEKVPVIELAHLTDTQRRAYILADNRLAEDAGWDIELLRVEFAGLLDDGVDLNLLGFHDDEIARVLDEATGGDGGGAADQSGQLGTGVFEVLVTCGSEKEQVELVEELSRREIRCRVLTSFRKAEKA